MREIPNLHNRRRRGRCSDTTQNLSHQEILMLIPLGLVYNHLKTLYPEKPLKICSFGTGEKVSSLSELFQGSPLEIQTTNAHTQLQGTLQKNYHRFQPMLEKDIDLRKNRSQLLNDLEELLKPFSGKITALARLLTENKARQKKKPFNLGKTMILPDYSFIYVAFFS